MSYAAAIESLFALAGELHAPAGQPRRKFELGQMRVLAAALGDPQMQFPSVLIAGTNGKGSTSATLASILRAAGYRVGLYTSPHLMRVNERVWIDGNDISDDDFARFYFQVDDTARRLVDQGRLPDHPSFFESMTALAFCVFAEAKIDIAVLEVGMGGRLDATNIVEPLVSVITDISLDHMEWLGPTITAIAHEKAGILRQNGVMVTLPQHPEANYALGEVATSLNVRGVNAAEYIPSRTTHSDAGRNHYALQVKGWSIEVDSPLAGQHQRRNLALAIATAVELCNCHGYKIITANIEQGIRDTRWPGRMERFGNVLLDVGHNPAGAWALRSVLAEMETQKQILHSAQDDKFRNGQDDKPVEFKTLIFGCLGDKPVAELAQILFPLFDHVLLTPVDSPRSASIEELSKAADAVGADFELCADGERALERAKKLTPPDGLIVGTGSVYLVGVLRRELAR
ncbi:folylpolyglutamate synthase/dihydrofolate synthase family protein [Alloacidobacterium sp.]|uniref:bifunctional folylpolyglutamate synthase/dihydrofolate synthase n=1 Tax=Alloacidobacterium sp. TaxID=2951999 RepID=UPI002D64C22A|nr:folylpolyglutamate synthase/dihydrofolate synthase family protein [Alloacidobacterium sp.]HYK38031.1 folylpolyglutamate synthase/dihydrofolate synthase family protein [Alloacidobacterium sp.]